MYRHHSKYITINNQGCHNSPGLHKGVLNLQSVKLYIYAQILSRILIATYTHFVLCLKYVIKVAGKIN